MKKFMRIALVFALAGATLMYTGCTKDYSGDISDLNNQLGKQEAAITTLQAQVNAAQTTANEALEAAKKADDKAAIAELEARIKKLEEAQAKIDAVVEQIKKDTKADVEKALAEIKAEVDALIESLGLTGLEAMGNVYLPYAEFNGVFAGHSKAEWKGSRELPQEGSIVTSPYTSYIYAQVTPSNYDLAKAELSIENILGVEAPAVFGTPLTIEEAVEEFGVKSVSETGVYVVPVNAKEFTNKEELIDALNAFYLNENGYGWTPCALVAGQARSSYLSSINTKAPRWGGLQVYFDTVDPDDYGYFDFETEEVELSEATGKNIVIPDCDECEAVVYDYFITDIHVDASMIPTSKEAIAKLGIKFDGQTVTYDVDKVSKYFSRPDVKESSHPSIEISVAVSQLNLAGYIWNKDENGNTITATFYIVPDIPEEPEWETVEYEWEATDTIKVVANIDPEKQTIKIDLTKAMKAWGLDDTKSAEYAIFEAGNYDSDLTPDNMDSDETAYFYGSDDDIYGTSFDPYDEFNYTEFALTATDKAGKAVYAPSVTAYFNENYPHLAELMYDEEEEAWVPFDAIGHVFYINVELEPNAPDYFTNYVVKNIPVLVTAPDASKWYKWEFAADNVATQADTITVLRTDGSAGEFDYGAGFKLAKGVPAGSVVLDATNAAAATKDSKWVVEGATITNPKFTTASVAESVKGLAVTALDDRTFPINNIKVIVKNVAAQHEPTISFNPETLEIGYTAGSFEVLTNSVYEPYNTPEAFYGSFTLKDANGKELYISKPSTTSPAYRPVQTVHTFKKVGDAWVSADGLINVADQAYECNFGTALTTNIQPAYGLKISAAQDLFDYYGQQIKVEVTFDEGGVNYVATKEKVAADFTVSFFVTIK